jgi:glutamyl-tRNA synthetase
MIWCPNGIRTGLLARGDAYPCFLTSVERDDIRARQSAAGVPTGLYGEWAKWRDADELDIIAKLNAGEVPSIRLYSRGDPSRRIFCKDAVRGSISFPENNADEVIIKSNDGLPTYHFAHLVDDHFMRTTHVVRGEEWLPSFPLHIAMFNMMGWTPPAYIHTSTIDKIDEESGKQRKISKRKDPEANVEFFVKEGYPTESVLDYLLNILSSGYEDERAKNPSLRWDEYPIKIKKIPTSGALFDFGKLNWWAREDIARYSAAQIYDLVSEWNPDGIVGARANSCGGIGSSRTISDHWLSDNRDYLIKIFGIERNDPKRVRKDFTTWKQTLEEVSFFFDDKFDSGRLSHPACGGGQPQPKLLREFLTTFDIADDKDTWWAKIVKIAAIAGVKNGDVAMALRVALTGRTNTPDLYSIMQVMGETRVRSRINDQIKKTG